MSFTKTLKNGNGLHLSIEIEEINGKKYNVTYWIETKGNEVIRKWRPTRREMLIGSPA